MLYTQEQNRAQERLSKMPMADKLIVLRETIELWIPQDTLAFAHAITVMEQLETIWPNRFNV